MNNLIDLEKKINSELGTKINTSEIKHNQIYLEIDSEDLIDVVSVSYTHLRAHETRGNLVCRLLLEKKK